MISMSTSLGKALTLLFLPYLSAFLLQSNQILRTYIAVVVAPVPTPSLPSQPEQASNSVDVNILSTTPGYKWRVIPAISVLSVLSLVQFRTVFPHPTVPTLQAVNEYFFCACLFYSVINITIQIIYPSKDIIHRAPNGKCVTVREGGLGLAAKQHPFFILLLILSITFFAYLMVASLYTNDSIPIAVVTMAFVASAIMVGKVPLITPYSFFIMAIVLALFTSFKYGNTSTYKLEEDEVWTTNLFKNMRYATFLPAALGSFLSGPFIATMLRFDFNRFCTAEPHAKLSYETAPHPSDPTMGKGIVVPQSLSVKFSKPYYILALSTWSTVRITTLALCIITGFPSKSPYDACTFGILLELPIMTIVLLLFATVRGEAGALWEVWVKKPSIVKKPEPVVKEGELIIMEENKLVAEKEDEPVVMECGLLLLSEDKVVLPNEDFMV